MCNASAQDDAVPWQCRPAWLVEGRSGCPPPDQIVSTFVAQPYVQPQPSPPGAWCRGPNGCDGVLAYLTWTTGAGWPGSSDWQIARRAVCRPRVEVPAGGGHRGVTEGGLDQVDGRARARGHGW